MQTLKFTSTPDQWVAYTYRMSFWARVKVLFGCKQVHLSRVRRWETTDDNDVNQDIQHVFCLESDDVYRRIMAGETVEELEAHRNAFDSHE